MSDTGQVAAELRETLETFPETDLETGLAEARRRYAEFILPETPAHLAAVRFEQRHIPGPAGAPDVRVLIYAPPEKASAPRPAVLHIHGGGYVVGRPEMNDWANRADALAQDCVVVSVDYRLAPETRWDGSRADNYAALCWLAENAATLGVDPARIAIAGESAGGGHAAMLALHARDRRLADPSGPDICFLLLDAPMLDDRTTTAADPHPQTGQFVWTAARNRQGWRALLGCEPGSADVPQEASPARATDLAGMPPTWIGVGGLDLFLEEDMDFARRLSRAGVPVGLLVVPGAYHGFTVAYNSPQALTFRANREAALRRGLAGADRL